jgi:hypothetical protein
LIRLTIRLVIRLWFWLLESVEVLFHSHRLGDVYLWVVLHDCLVWLRAWADWLFNRRLFDRWWLFNEFGLR